MDVHQGLATLRVCKYRGVSWSSSHGCWLARVYWMDGGRKKSAWAGRHISEEVAARARDTKAIELLGLDRARNKLNFPLE